MLYEKKMLILSGAGKGVVLIEKSAYGAKFTLRTFDMPPCAPLKAGVVTKTKVFVRDLPNRDNPASTFTLELDSLDDLHFAVFDRELRLYGCTGKRMWEANLMGLLVKNDRRPPVADGVPRAPLPPIAQPPRTLPLPDGTGIPQSRLSVYGDDALAENDFYTKIDVSARMPAVDEFLDSPRVLDGLAPRIEPAREAVTEISSEVSEKPIIDAAATDGQASDETNTDPTEKENENHITAEASAGILTDVNAATTAAADEQFDISEELPDLPDIPELSELEDDAEQIEDKSTGQEETDGAQVTAQNAETAQASPASVDANNGAPTAGDSKQGDSTAEQSGALVEDEFEPIAEVAADAAVEQPWERTARWIKKRSGRELVIKKPRVRSVPASEKLKHLRATEFFERARRDIDILFASARRDESLAGLIDDVEWVKVDVDGNSVSVGRSGNAFLCYAVAGTYERTPPLGEEAQWLPADRAAPTGKGYWVIFQNLSTGEIIK